MKTIAFSITKFPKFIAHCQEHSEKLFDEYIFDDGFESIAFIGNPGTGLWINPESLTHSLSEKDYSAFVVKWS